MVPFDVAFLVAKSDATSLALFLPSLRAGVIDVDGVADVPSGRTWAQLAASYGLRRTRAAMAESGADLCRPVCVPVWVWVSALERYLWIGIYLACVSILA